MRVALPLAARLIERKPSDEGAPARSGFRFVLFAIAAGLLRLSQKARTKEVRAVQLPEPFRFLRIGWWIIHIIAIGLVFLLGRLSVR